MSEENKKVKLDLDINDSQFQSKLRTLLDNVSRETDKFLDTKEGSHARGLSNKDRIDVEKSKMREFSNDFYKKYSPEAISSATKNYKEQGIFARAEDKYVVETDKLIKTISELDKSSKNRNNEDEARHREYRKLTIKDLELRKEEERHKQRESLQKGEFDQADEHAGNIRAISKAISEQGGNTNAAANSQERFMRQFARNFFTDRALGSLASMNHDISIPGRALQGGYQAFSAAQSAGLSGMKAGGIGLAMAAIDGLVGLFQSGNKVHEEYLKAGSSLDYESIKSSYDRKSRSYADLGIGGSDDLEKLIQEHSTLSREYGSGNRISRNVYDENVLKKVYGVSGGEVSAFKNQTQIGRDAEKTYNSLEGTRIFTMMLQKLDTGINIGDSHGVGKDLSRLPKYLEKFNSLQEQSLRTTGRRGTDEVDATMRMFGSVIGLGGIFKYEDNASDLVSGIRNSFANPSDEMHRYLNVSAARSVMGNVSDTDLRIAMEDMNNPEIVNAAVQQLRNRWGNQRFTNAGESGYMSDLQSLLGLNSFSKAVEFNKQFDLTQGLSKDQLDLYNKYNVDEDYDKAKNLTSEKEKNEALIGKEVTSFAESITKFSESVNKLVGSWFKKDGTIRENVAKDGGVNTKKS